MHAHVGFYRVTPGALDASVAGVRDVLLPLIRDRLGQWAYTVLTSADSFVSLSGWETRAQAERAAAVLSGWVEKMGRSVVAMGSDVGTVILLHGEAAPDRTPTYGVVRVATPKPDAPDLTEKIRAELLPLFDRQPGFVVRVTIRADDGGQITFIGWDSEEAYGQEHPIREWSRRNVAPHMDNTAVHKGTVAWAVRNG